MSPSIPINNKQLKPARLMAVLQQESTVRNQEQEVQSEASFQRLVASHAELPLAFHPRTLRSARGRFPEEVGGEDYTRKGDDSDDDDDDDVVFGGGTSGEGSVVDEARWGSDSPAMDIEMVSPFQVNENEFNGLIKVYLPN